MLYHVQVYVSIKQSVLDPQGKTVNEALHHLGYPNIDKTRIGKYITFDIDGENEEVVRSQIKDICDKVLTNPIIETYSYTIEKD